jgi:serine phosphatase RsbU (regulator of sigma subunit)
MRDRDADMAGTAADGLLGLTTSLSAAGEPGEILDAMTAWCPVLLRADLVNISLLDSERRTLRLVSSVNTPAPVAEEFASYPVDAPLPSRDALRTGETVVLRSVAERDAAYPELAGVVVEQESFCVVPLRIRGEGIGVLGLGWDVADRMDDEVLALSRTVGELCAAALHRALAAHDEAEARQRAESLLVRLGGLQRVAAELSYVDDIESAARIVLASALETLGAEAATFNLLDDEAREGTLVASLGIDDSPIATLHCWRVSGSMLVQELLRTGLPVLLRDHAEQHARFPDLDRSNVRQPAWANVLLRSGPRVLGLVSFGWAEAREFDIAEVALMQALADHLAAAVERARLTQINTELLAERTRVAETLQRSLLPAPLPDWPGVVMAAGYEPADVGTEVCGDFYDVFEASDGSLIVVIGDVAGRGIEAAGLTGMARHTLRALAGDMSPQEALLRLNTAVVDRSRGGDQRLLTAGIVRLFQEERGLCAEVALAGHCMPVLLSCRSARHVGTPGMMLGATDAPVIGTAQVDLEPGDVLVLHTDGVLEARRNGVEFGEDRLLRLLSALSDPGPEAVVEHVLSSVRWFRTTAPDDMAVVAFKVLG